MGKKAGAGKAADYSAEERFVRTFIQKNRQERLLLELTTPARRYRGISRFCHQARELLDPEKIALEGGDLERLPDFERFVRQHEGPCLVLSTDGWLSEQLLPLREAVNRAALSPEEAVILGGDFAVVFGEAMKGGREKFLLCETGKNRSGLQN